LSASTTKWVPTWQHFILFYFILLYVLASFGHLATKKHLQCHSLKKGPNICCGKKLPKSPDFEDSLENLPYLENQFLQVTKIHNHKQVCRGLGYLT
jgi:hypothetical protein